ncbi:MAG: STM4013/SEN3800 family hydrolase [Gemmataceae bacterium]
MIDMNQVVGSHHILFVTLDTLRYDVAIQCWEESRTPNFQRLLPPSGWEKRHTPGNFTYAAHQAFFAGFLPTPAKAEKHTRLFALRFPGSETTGSGTYVMDAPDIITGLANVGYRTICIGGVGFFNQLTPLGRVLPGYFAESYWDRKVGVTDPRSFEHQIDHAAELLQRVPSDEFVFLFINVSALHQPNYYYLQDEGPDSLTTQAAALEYVDRHVPKLFDTLSLIHPWFCIFCSDHGTAYGEDGYFGHRINHPVVWTVPYAEFFWPSTTASNSREPIE